MNSRRIRQLLLIAAACSAVQGIAQAQDASTTPTPLTAIPESDIAQLRQTLFDSATKHDQRDAAAERLLVRPGDEARTAIRDALMDLSQPAAQLSAVRALSEIPTADPSFITPLFALLEPGARKEVIDAAAMALGSYKDNPDVLTRLLSIARDGSDITVRLAAIRATGTFVEKRVGQSMLNLMNPTAQPQAINQAAKEALSYMVGMDADVTTMDDWSKWWKANQDKSDQQFKADLVQSRANRYDFSRQQLDELQTEIGRMLQEQYQKAVAAQRPEVLIRALRATQPAIRAAGARIAGSAAVGGDFIAPQVKEQMRTLIGDASPNVRRQIALALALINDAEAIVPLLTQLKQETDSSVRAAIAQAIAPIRDPRSVEPLLTLLSDPRVETARAAASALSEPELGRQLQATNPALADRAAEILMRTLRQRTTPQNESDLRSDLARAVGAMQSQAQGGAIAKLLPSPAEVPKVRRSLLWAAGMLKLPDLADPIAQCLSDPDPTVRLAAIKALGQTANSFNQQRQLADLIDPARESTAEVREAAWNVLSELFKLAQDNQLEPFVMRFKAPEKADEATRRDAATRRLVVLRILRDRARGASKADELAGYEQQIGDAAIDAGFYDEAVTSLRAALQIAVQRKQGPREEFVSETLIRALLRGRKYSEAVKFFQEQIKKDMRFQTALSSEIRLEAERLNESKDLGAAKQLIGLALASTPPLQDNQRQLLESLDRKIDNRTREQNQMRMPELPVNASAN